MTSLTDTLTDREIGRRLRISRQVARLRQADAAGAIGVARTTLVAIEQGRRRIRTQELQELAFLYGTSANAILRRGTRSISISYRSSEACPAARTKRSMEPRDCSPSWSAPRSSWRVL